MGRFYFVDGCYAPNTASGNRLWAMLKVLSEMKTDTEVIYFMSDSQQSEAPRLKHIHFNYYWKKLYIKSPKLQILAFIYILECFCENSSLGILYIHTDATNC